MPTVIIETEINAPPEICFDLIRDVSLQTNFGKTKPHGKIILGETVNFESKFLGFKQNLVVKVTELEKPFLLTDEMVSGNFKSFKHIHEFIPNKEKTLLKDTLIWTSPLGIFGQIFDRLFIEKRLRKIVERRNEELKSIAESK